MNRTFIDLIQEAKELRSSYAQPTDQAYLKVRVSLYLRGLPKAYLLVLPRPRPCMLIVQGDNDGRPSSATTTFLLANCVKLTAENTHDGWLFPWDIEK